MRTATLPGLVPKTIGMAVSAMELPGMVDSATKTDSVCNAPTDNPPVRVILTVGNGSKTGATGPLVTIYLPTALSVRAMAAVVTICAKEAPVTVRGYQDLLPTIQR